MPALTQWFYVAWSFDVWTFDVWTWTSSHGPLDMPFPTASSAPIHPYVPSFGHGRFAGKCRFLDGSCPNYTNPPFINGSLAQNVPSCVGSSLDEPISPSF